MYHSWGHCPLGPRGTAAPPLGLHPCSSGQLQAAEKLVQQLASEFSPFGWEMPLVAECNDSSTSRSAQTPVIRTVYPEGFLRADARHECEGSPSWSWDPSYQAGIARLAVMEGTGAKLGPGWIWAWG